MTLSSLISVWIFVCSRKSEPIVQGAAAWHDCPQPVKALDTSQLHRSLSASRTLHLRSGQGLHTEGGW